MSPALTGTWSILDGSSTTSPDARISFFVLQPPWRPPLIPHGGIVARSSFTVNAPGPRNTYVFSIAVPPRWKPAPPVSRAGT